MNFLQWIKSRNCVFLQETLFGVRCACHPKLQIFLKCAARIYSTNMVVGKRVREKTRQNQTGGGGVIQLKSPIPIKVITNVELGEGMIATKTVGQIFENLRWL